MPVHEALKAIPKTKKAALKSKGKQAIEQKDAQLSTGAALPEENTSHSGQDIEMAPQEQPLKYKKGGNEKGMYQKTFITRITICLSLSMGTQLNETKAKVDLKQIIGTFSKWLVESFDPYSASFVLPNGQRFTVIACDVYVTLGVTIRGREIMEITRSSTNEEYDEVHAAWLRE
ncbi:hypothetical protein Cgig2_029016 [Carnegiea gigantea]|uniref:Uncharacterized protein n=1 Tax=Carnegiea gigantea TaxID=171969 RepID=A0A9Q1JWI6_9CARY|nr:hypothetical protein Cgig2_029016 [Carnegiea gigantea]